MELKQPYKVYTAASNIEVHLIVEMLGSNGIDAYAVEDQSGVSLFSFGTIGQFHQPNVWVEKSTAQAAAELIDQFFEKDQPSADSSTNASPIEVECEECGKVSTFPESQNGTTQDCSHCSAYVDVGELDWDENFGEADE
ncbi:MAG: hypothetical protein COA78_38600 [Blastopirellula sp.]|nr:MAG: hypothetical protein COA78_38600 [Blastopirellula sp.]